MKVNESASSKAIVGAILFAVSMGLLGGCGGAAPSPTTRESTLVTQIQQPLTTPSSTAKPTSTNTPTATSTNTSTPTPVPACGGPPLMLILGVGTDSRSNTYLYGLADVIRIIRVDFVNLEVSVLAIPRALLVEIPGIADHGITSGLLNQAYFYGAEGMGYYDHPARGAGLLALTLQANFDVTVDHYVVMNMTTFRYLVDELGGIYVGVPYTMDARHLPSDPPIPEKYYFPGGLNYFRGEAALAYARLRKLDDIFARDMRQSDILLAMRERVLDPDFIANVPQVIDYYYNLIRTDLSLEQINQLFCLGQSVPEGSISFVGWPGGMFVPAYTAEGLSYLSADMEVIREDIQRFVEGTWR